MFDSAQTPCDGRFIFRIVPKLDTPSVASMPQEAGYRRPALTLSLGDYNAHGASISSSGDGAKFAFTIWPLSDETVAALEDVVQKHERICLYCCRVPLLFALVLVERKEPHKARIEGRIVGGVSYAKDATA